MYRSTSGDAGGATRGRVHAAARAIITSLGTLGSGPYQHAMIKSCYHAWSILAEKTEVHVSKTHNFKNSRGVRKFPKL